MRQYLQWDAIKDSLRTYYSIKATAPVKHSPAIARRMDDFPIPA